VPTNSFRDLFYLPVKETARKFLRGLILGEDAFISIGLISVLTQFITIPDRSKPYFIGSLILAVLAKPFVWAENIRHGSYVVAQNLILLSYFLIVYGLLVVVGIQSRIYIILLVIVGAVHLYLLYPNFLFIRNFWRISHAFALFITIAYLLSHGSAVYLYVMVWFEGGF